MRAEQYRVETEILRSRGGAPPEVRGRVERPFRRVEKDALLVRELGVAEQVLELGRLEDLETRRDLSRRAEHARKLGKSAQVLVIEVVRLEKRRAALDPLLVKSEGDGERELHAGALPARLEDRAIERRGGSVAPGPHRILRLDHRLVFPARRRFEALRIRERPGDHLGVVPQIHRNVVSLRRAVHGDEARSHAGGGEFPEKGEERSRAGAVVRILGGEKLEVIEVDIDDGRFLRSERQVLEARDRERYARDRAGDDLPLRLELADGGGREFPPLDEKRPVRFGRLLGRRVRGGDHPDDALVHPGHVADRRDRAPLDHRR